MPSAQTKANAYEIISGPNLPVTVMKCGDSSPSASGSDSCDSPPRGSVVAVLSLLDSPPCSSSDTSITGTPFAFTIVAVALLQLKSYIVSEEKIEQNPTKQTKRELCPPNKEPAAAARDSDNQNQYENPATSTRRFLREVCVIRVRSENTQLVNVLASLT